MRGTAAGYRLDASSYLTDPRTAAFSAADLGALALLTAHAWVQGGEITNDPESLAAMSRLGAAWAGSRVAASLHLFFRVGAARLVSIDLEPQIDHARRVSESRSLCGARGGRPKKAIGKQLLSNCFPIALREGGEATGGPTGPLEEGVQPSEPPRKPPGTVKCSVSLPTGAGETGPESNCFPAQPGVFLVPPHTPLYRDKKLSLSGDGGVGEGGATNTPPLDLFGEPIKARGRKKAQKPTQAHRDAASLIVDAYMDEVGPEESRTSRADANVSKWIAEGASVEDLRASITHYARLCDRTNRDPRYRKAAQNFFGRDGAFWRGYVKEPTSAAAASNGNARPPGRIRTGKSYEGIGVTVSTAEAGTPAASQEPMLEGAEHRQNPFRA